MTALCIMNDMLRSQSVILFILTSLMPLSLIQEDPERPAQGFLRIFMYNPEGPWDAFAMKPCWILEDLTVSWYNPHENYPAESWRILTMISPVIFNLVNRSLWNSLPIKDLLRSVKDYLNTSLEYLARLRRSWKKCTCTTDPSDFF